MLYLDPAYATGGGEYEHQMGFYEKLLAILEGRPELVGNPYTPGGILPPHADFSRRDAALDSLSALFANAAGRYGTMIVSYNTTSEVSVRQVAGAGETFFGPLTARDGTELPRPTRDARERRTTETILVFKGRRGEVTNGRVRDTGRMCAPR